MAVLVLIIILSILFSLLFVLRIKGESLTNSNRNDLEIPNNDISSDVETNVIQCDVENKNYHEHIGESVNLVSNQVEIRIDEVDSKCTNNQEQSQAVIIKKSIESIDEEHLKRIEEERVSEALRRSEIERKIAERKAEEKRSYLEEQERKQQLRQEQQRDAKNRAYKKKVHAEHIKKIAPLLEKNQYLADRIKSYIEKGNLRLDSKIKVSHFLVLMWYNPIPITDDLLNVLKNKMEPEIYLFLMDKLDSHHIKAEFDTTFKMASFVTMVYNLHIMPSKLMNQNLKRGISWDSFVIYKSGIDILYNLKKQSELKEELEHIRYKNRQEWFFKKIEERYRDQRFKYLEPDKYDGLPKLGYASVCDKFPGVFPISTAM